MQVLVQRTTEKKIMQATIKARALERDRKKMESTPGSATDVLFNHGQAT